MTDLVVKTEEKTPPAPVPGSPEYDAAMVKKFDSILPEDQREKPASPAAGDKPAKPEGVPDKFWNAETGKVDYTAWSKSTDEAQRKITELSTTQKTDKEAADKKAAEAAATAKTEEKVKLEKALTDAKAANKPEDVTKAQQALDAFNATNAPKSEEKPNQAPDLKALMAELGAELSKEDGKISDESYAKFEKAGIDKATLDSHIAGQRALATIQRQQILAAASVTEEQWKAMSAWAQANLSQEEKVSLNKQLSTPDAAANAMRGLKDRYTQANGQDPKLMGGGRGGENTGYQSLDAYKADLKNPRYEKEEAFRAEVERKLTATTVF